MISWTSLDEIAWQGGKKKKKKKASNSVNASGKAGGIPQLGEAAGWVPVKC